MLRPTHEEIIKLKRYFVTVPRERCLPCYAGVVPGSTRVDQEAEGVRGKREQSLYCGSAGRNW